MRALLIDATVREITEIDFPGGIENVSAILGCHSFTTGSRPFNGSLETGFDTLRVSDDYLEDRGDPKHWFQIDAERETPSSYPLAGRGLVVGIDSDGEDCDARISLDELRSRVTFTRRKFRGFAIRRGREFELHGIRAVSLLEVEVKAPVIEES